MYPKELKAETQTDSYTQIFIAALLTVTPKNGNNPNVHQLINGATNSDLSRYGILFDHKNEIQTHATEQKNLENIKLSERNKKQKVNIV